MRKYKVRVVGTAPVWADIEVEADSVAEARELAAEESPEDSADWQLCDGGNGVDDWEFAEVFDEDGEEVTDEEDEEDEEEEVEANA